MERKEFHIVDYIVFAAVLLISLGIGVYHAFAGGKQKSTDEYLMGGRKLKLIPVSLSILVTMVSSIGLLGTAAEMYAYGTQFSMHLIAAILGCAYGAVLFVPLFYPLKLTSSFEYFELRFKTKPPRLICSFLLLLSGVLSNGASFFAPSVALEAVTGCPEWASIILLGVVTTAYTTMGGMKAVVWTDVFQSVIILAGLVTVCIVGSIKCGGFAEIWRVNDEWGRIEFFDFDPDPRKRTTFWSVVVMMSVLCMCMTVAQPAVQRYCALPTLRQAKLAIFLNIPGFVINGFLTCFAGIIAFAYYAKTGCDPLMDGRLTNLNQILPYFVMDIMDIPGLPGLFVACIYSAALSTASSLLNSMGAVTWEDFFKLKLSNISPTKQATTVKVIVMIYGALGIGMSFLVKNMGGTLVQIVFTIIGCTVGPIVGMFILGALWPRAGPKGAFLGTFIGLVMGFWMAFGAILKKIHTMPLPFPTETCFPVGGNMSITVVTNMTMIDATGGNVTNDIAAPPMMPPSQELKGLDNYYAVSYLWYPTVGILCVLVTGILTSFIPGFEQGSHVPKHLLFPGVHWCCVRCQPPPDMEDEIKAPLNGLENDRSLIYVPTKIRKGAKNNPNELLLVKEKESVI